MANFYERWVVDSFADAREIKWSLTLNRQNEKMKRDADNVYCQVPAMFGRMVSFIILDNAYFF